MHLSKISFIEMYLKQERNHSRCNKTKFLIILQNIFHAVVEVPRWTNAKMEVFQKLF